jgi:hypothetical protein
MPVGAYLIFVAVMVGLYCLATGLPVALDRARSMATDIGREVSLPFR